MIYLIFAIIYNIAWYYAIKSISFWSKLQCCSSSDLMNDLSNKFIPLIAIIDCVLGIWGLTSLKHTARITTWLSKIILLLSIFSYVRFYSWCKNRQCEFFRVPFWCLYIGDLAPFNLGYMRIICAICIFPITIEKLKGYSMII